MNETISISVENHIADIRLNRPDKLNALNGDLIDGIIEAAAWVNTQAEIRCVVLSGEGRGFCAGLDMSSFQDIANGELADLSERTHGIANRVQQVCWGWRECKVPVIAAIKGMALGGGFQMALGADIRISESEAKFSIMEIKWGLIPDMGGTALMCHLAPEDIVRELSYTGRIFQGKEAHSIGLVTHLSDEPYQKSMALAAEIANRNPDAIQACKTLFNKVGDKRAEELLMNESTIQSQILSKPNQIEAVMAALEKRPAKFKDAG